MASPASCRYSESHEWFKVEGDLVVMGITQFAVDELTDITYAEVKPVGTSVQPGGSVAEVESVKTASDIYSPISGEVVAANSALPNNPSLVNTAAPFPYGLALMRSMASSSDGARTTTSTGPKISSV